MEYLLIGGGLFFLLSQMGKSTSGGPPVPPPQPRKPGPGEPGYIDPGLTDAQKWQVGTSIATGILGTAGLVVSVLTKTGVIGASTVAPTTVAAGGGGGGGGGSAGGGGAGALTQTTYVSGAGTLSASEALGGAAAAIVIIAFIALVTVGPIISDLVSGTYKQWSRDKQVRGGLRYGEMILYTEQKKFEAIMEGLQNTLKVNPPISFSRDYFGADQFAALGWLFTGNTYYYVNSVDVRLPVHEVNAARGFCRFVEWAQVAEMNRCLYNFYGTRPTAMAPGTPQERSSQALSDQGQRLYSMPPENLRIALENFFANLPAKYTPPERLAWTYEELRASALLVMQAAKAAGKTQDTFDDLERKLRFIGAARAVHQASSTDWEQQYSGDQQYTISMGERLGLLGAGWSRDVWGGRPVLVDNATGWGIDVAATRTQNSIVVYKTDQLRPLSGVRAFAGTSRFARMTWGRYG